MKIELFTFQLFRGGIAGIKQERSMPALQSRFTVTIDRHMFIGAIGCEPLQLARVQLENSESLDVYRKHGGYEALKKVLVGNVARRRHQRGEEVGLRGRGGAGFPTGMKWSFVPKDSPKAEVRRLQR